MKIEAGCRAVIVGCTAQPKFNNTEVTVVKLVGVDCRDGPVWETDSVLHAPDGTPTNNVPESQLKRLPDDDSKDIVSLEFVEDTVKWAPPLKETP